MSASYAGHTAFALRIPELSVGNYLFPSADDFFEVGDGLLQPVFERYCGLPVEHGAGERDIGPALNGVILWE